MYQRIKNVLGGLLWQNKTRNMSKQQLKELKRNNIIRDALEGKIAAPATLYEKVLNRFKEIKEPLYLISQVQRSGGSLLAQLFDGHPQCHAHPYEIKIGFPDKTVWPAIEEWGDPELVFNKLFEHDSIWFFMNGYRKPGAGSRKKGVDETFPFYLIPKLQKDIFLKYIGGIANPTPRDFLDAYFTSYFNAWVNNHNFVGQKKCIVGFTPMLLVKQDNMRRFFQTYPQGKLISLIRDPYRWLASAKRHHEKYARTEQAMRYWIDSTEAAMRNYKEFPEKVRICKFEDLIQNTEVVMKGLCQFLGLDYIDSLLDPTFNRELISANSSFKVSGKGIVKDVVARPINLAPEDKQYIEDNCMALYEKALKHATV